jgi:arylsulfatase A-like enzyme
MSLLDRIAIRNREALMTRTAVDRSHPGPGLFARARCAAACWTALLLLPAAAAAAAAVAAAEAADPPPNFVVILIDDAALMDLGAYGGDARTPHIDALAGQGARFTHYYTSPLCAPSRAMLLTGADSHRTGVATIPEVLPKNLRGQPGYTMALEPGVTTVSTRLRAAGYRTYMTGKWHLGHQPGQLPVDHGFDRSFILDASGADNWEQKSYMPYYRHADWFEDGDRATLPEDFYSSAFLVDRMIDYLESGDQERPFLAYVAFQAIHIPIQAPKEFVDRYDGVFDEGWEALRQARWQRAVTLGLVPADAALPEAPAGTRAWADLSDDERALYAKSMAVNAAMLEAMDHHVGRLIAHLQETGAYRNTIFIVASDNGPEPSHPASQRGMGAWMALNGYHRRLDDLGERGSYAFIGTEWAIAAATPGSLFKFYTSEGGIRAPLIVARPGNPAPARIDALAFVTDITPTLLDYAGLDPAPADGAVAIDGRSLRPVLEGRQPAVYGPEDTIGIEVSGNAALFRGDYKLVRNLPPWGDGQWRLFQFRLDPGETADLSERQPELFAEMLAAYDDYARNVGVLPLPDGYHIEKQLGANSISRQLGLYHWELAGVGLTLLALLWLGVLSRSRRRRTH